MNPTRMGPAPKNPLFTILVADEELSFDGVISDFIAAEGHFVLRARTASEALIKTAEFRPQMILLNRALDKGRGLDILTELMMDDAGAAVVLLAKEPKMAEIVEAMKLGAADYLELPLDPAKLKQAIETQTAFFRMR